ncbi:MAG: PglZ domain-containing protein [Clostridiales bacterium]|jgi:hypothetical protein|nr:PglZ domain-containing protein [Clostridiales bacterium]
MLDYSLSKLLFKSNENKLLVFAQEGICEITEIKSLLNKNGYTVYEYLSAQEFRIVFEEKIKNSLDKIAVIVLAASYVPFDIRRAFYEVTLSASTIFPEFNLNAVSKYLKDWDIISFAANSSYADYSHKSQTNDFIKSTVFSEQIIRKYCENALIKLKEDCENALSYLDWIRIAQKKASVEYYAALRELTFDMTFADSLFQNFINDGYGRLSTEVSGKFPPIITKAIPVIMADKNAKSALIVMDGMSLFDFKAISYYLDEFQYDFGCSYAIIPTTTPISRQSLLSGKFPRELSKPFSLANEEREFKACIESYGISGSQIEYLRGYDAPTGPLTRFAAIIINEADDIVHGQRQGRAGMLADMNLLGKSGKLQSLINRLITAGFATYITSDHGNTLCAGVGSFRSGVEMQTSSKRMAVLKDFAEVNTLLAENTSEYQGFYLNKDYRYFVCNSGKSFDNKGEKVMAHGGMSLDEVIVPFIRIGWRNTNV